MRQSRLLVRHETVLKRLRKEVESVLGSETNITKSELQKMTYLKCVITESAYTSMSFTETEERLI